MKLDDRQPRSVLAKQARILNDREIRKAKARAVSRATSQARTLVGREIRQSVRLRARDVNEAMRLRRPRSSDALPTGEVRISFRPLPITKFGSPRQTRRGVSVAIWRGRSRTLYPSAFIVDQLSGLAFRRAGKQRLPIGLLFGPSIQMLAPRAFEKNAQAISGALESRLDHEVGRLVERAMR
jgi:hypothetical protein